MGFGVEELWGPCPPQLQVSSISILDIGIAAVGMAAVESSFVFDFCSSWQLGKKLPTTTWRTGKEKVEIQRLSKFSTKYQETFFRVLKENNLPSNITRVSIQKAILFKRKISPFKANYRELLLNAKKKGQLCEPEKLLHARLFGLLCTWCVDERILNNLCTQWLYTRSCTQQSSR